MTSGNITSYTSFAVIFSVVLTTLKTRRQFPREDHSTVSPATPRLLKEEEKASELTNTDLLQTDEIRKRTHSSRVSTD